MSGELILIVEDNEKNRILFRDILQARMMEAGFDSYLSKPINVTEFLKTIDNFFQKH